jgi:hypothetical protein
MSVTTQDLYGAASNAAPATPGSYGEPPAGYRLPDATRLGGVRLQVADLARSLAYYESVLGLRVLARDDARARLGAADGERRWSRSRRGPGRVRCVPAGGWDSTTSRSCSPTVRRSAASCATSASAASARELETTS